MDEICTAPWEKSIQGLSNAAQTCGAQHLEGRKVYSLSMLLILPY